MTKLNKYLKEIEEHIQTSYKIGTEAPAFREDVEALHGMFVMQARVFDKFLKLLVLEGFVKDKDLRPMKHALVGELESLIPGGSDD
jgi:hypothetical protein